MIPTLETERLILREWREDDFEPFAAIYADEAQARYIGGVETRDNAWRRMAAIIGHWRLRGYGLWVVAPKETGGFVGWAGCWNPRASRRRRSAIASPRRISARDMRARRPGPLSSTPMMRLAGQRPRA